MLLALATSSVTAEPAWEALSRKVELQIADHESLLIHNAAATDVRLRLANRNSQRLSGVARLTVPLSWRVEEGRNTPFELNGDGGTAALTFRLRLLDNVVPDVGEVEVVLRLFCGEDGIVAKRLTLRAQKVQEWLLLGPLDTDPGSEIFKTRPEDAFDSSEVVVASGKAELKWRRVRTGGSIDLARELGPLPEDTACHAILCSYVSFCGNHDRKLKERLTLLLESPNRAGVEINKTVVVDGEKNAADGRPEAPGETAELGSTAPGRGTVGVMLKEGWNFVVVRSHKAELDEKWNIRINFTASNEKHRGRVWYRYQPEERKDY